MHLLETIMYCPDRSLVGTFFYKRLIMSEIDRLTLLSSPSGLAMDGAPELLAPCVCLARRRLRFRVENDLPSSEEKSGLLEE